MRDLPDLRKAGVGALRLLADMFADDTNPAMPTDTDVEATIVFADVENFSDVVAHAGDDAASEVLDRLDRAVDATVEGRDARVVKRLGDGVMLCTEAPDIGLRVAATLPRAFTEAMADQPHPLRLRVGAHHGKVRKRGADLIGYHVNVAARVAERARGGQALVTGSLLDAAAAPAEFEASPAGTLAAKGVPEAPPLFLITPRSASATG